jgi:glycosyltransferase involved in cell wall biosynthesis
MDLDLLLPFHRIDRYFDSAVSSLEAVKGVNLNVILIDDRVEKIEDISNFQKRLRHCELVETNGGEGYGEALRVGSTYIDSDVVALFNSDDLVHPERFVRQMSALETSDLSFTKMARFQGNIKSRSLMGEFRSKTYDPFFLILGAYGANASWCMRKDWWMQNAFFDSHECLDWRIALKAFPNGQISYLDEELYFYRKHQNQVTSNRSIDKNDLQIVFRSWNHFSSNYNLGPTSFEVFSGLAIPWNKTNNLDLEELGEKITEIFRFVKSEKPDLMADFKRLIQRRYLFAIRQESKKLLKIKLLRAGFPQLFQVSSEVICQFATKPFQ